MVLAQMVLAQMVLAQIVLPQSARGLQRPDVLQPVTNQDKRRPAIGVFFCSDI